MGDRDSDKGYMGLGRLSPGAGVTPETTIVGGQPDRAAGGDDKSDGQQMIPVGLEQVLFTAAVSPAFGAELLERRLDAVADQGFSLTGIEQSVLRAIPRDQLATMIANIDVSQQNVARRDFLRSVAATLGVAAVGQSLVACDPPAEPTKGIRADQPTVPVEPSRPSEPPVSKDHPQVKTTSEIEIKPPQDAGTDPPRPPVKPLKTDRPTASHGIRSEPNPPTPKPTPKPVKIPHSPPDKSPGGRTRGISPK